MKVLQLISYFNPKRGGDTNVCYNLSLELSKLGHDVTIVTTDFELDTEYVVNVELEGVKVFNFPVLINLPQIMLYSPSMEKWLKRNIKNYDIIHLHNYRSHQSNIIYHLAKTYGIPYVLHAHGTVPRNIENEISKIFLRTIYDIIYGNKILNNACKLIANSKAELENFKKVINIEEKIDLVYNGIETRYKMPKKGVFKEKFNVKNKYILFLGRIDKTKGLNFLLESYIQFSREIESPVDLVIVGPPGNFSSELTEIIKEKNLSNIIQLDFLYGEDKLAAYQDAEMFICTPNYKSGVLLTPLESILCGTPVIVSKEIGELYEDPKIGFIVEYGNLNDLKNKMLILFKNPIIGQEMVEVGKKFISNNYNWKTVSQKVENLYFNCFNEYK